MSKIKIAGDVVVIESALTLENIQTLEKYNQRVLTLWETDESTGKKAEDFRIATAKGSGSINQYGASFSDKSHNADGLATITMKIPDDVEDVREWVADTYGGAVAKLNKIEAAAPEALAAVAEDRAKVMESITVL